MMRSVIRVIEFISEESGKVVAWLCLALVLVLGYEVTMRYVFNAPTIWVGSVATMLGCAIITLGLAYTHLHDGHVRVDVIYTRLSARGKAILDTVFFLLFFLPSIIMVIFISYKQMMFGWKIGMVMMETHWYPLASPIRTVFLLGFVLFALQGVARFSRDLHFILRNKPYD